ncbi:MAG: large conductance mechanosensitive channel protein MscL [Planctomycetota bacterium]
MGLIKEFRDFAVKGNMVDMAVGIIIGGAFGLIVKSLIDDVIMPAVGKVIGDVDFSNLYIPLSEAVSAAQAAAAEAGTVLTLGEARELGPVLAWGNFASILINFLILAFVIFIMVKMINNAKKKFEKEQEAAPPKAPPEELTVLKEIRDALAKNG